MRERTYVCLRASDENKRERERGLDSGVYYHLKRGDDSRAGRPVPANIRRERERGRNGFAIVRSFKVQPPGTPGARRFLFLTFLFRQPHLALLHFLFLLLRAALLLFPGRISILIFFHPFFFHVRTSVISSSSFFPSATPFPLRPTRPPPLTFVPLSCHPPKEVIFLDLACGLRSSVTKGVRRGKGRERDEFSCNFAASCFYALSPSLSRFYLLLLLLPQTPFIGRLTHLSWYAERVLSRLFLF